MEAVKTKCGGCERRLLFRWRWHGGGEGTAGTSSQKAGGALSAPRRTIISAGIRTGSGALCTNGGPPWTCAARDIGEHGGGTPLSPSRHIRPLCSTSEQQWPSMTPSQQTSRWCHMKNDSEVKLYMFERSKGKSQRLAAARAGMSERTARKYERAGKLPSELKRPHDWKTRTDPFEQDWPWVVEQLERDPALQASTLFALLCEKHPGRYRPTQDRTLRRHIARWRALYGPEQEVIFEQQHIPGERAQSDFTHMEDLGVTIAGVPFPHLVYHLVLTYSNAEAISICFSETFEALAEGIEQALWQLGGVPEQHRTDHLSAAVHRLDKSGQEDWTKRYDALMAHYGMQPTWNNTGVAHENGDVEQSHYRFKEAVDQALRVRGSREFPSRAAYDRFLHELVRQRNLTRSVRFTTEGEALRPLPVAPLAPCKEVRVSVSRFSTIHLDSNVYSVPSRLIGTSVMVRVRAETLEGFVGSGL